MYTFLHVCIFIYEEIYIWLLFFCFGLVFTDHAFSEVIELNCLHNILIFFVVLELPCLYHLMVCKMCLLSYHQSFNEIQVDLLGIREKKNGHRPFLGKCRTMALLSRMLVYSSSFSCLL